MKTQLLNFQADTLITKRSSSFIFKRGGIHLMLWFIPSVEYCDMFSLFIILHAHAVMNEN